MQRRQLSGAGGAKPALLTAGPTVNQTGQFLSHNSRPMCSPCRQALRRCTAQDGPLSPALPCAGQPWPAQSGCPISYTKVSTGERPAFIWPPWAGCNAAGTRLLSAREVQGTGRFTSPKKRFVQIQRHGWHGPG